MSTTPRRQPALSTLRTLRSALAVALATLLLAGTFTAAPSHASSPGSKTPSPRREPRLLISVLPQLHQPKAHAATLAGARSVVTVTLSAKRMVRPVKLQRRDGSTWRTVAAKTIHRGEARFTVTDRPNAVYRAVLPPHDGRRFVRSAAVADPWGSPDWADEFNGDELGPAWEHRIQFYNPWGGRSCSKGDPAAVEVSAGRLLLSSMPDPHTDQPCTVTDDQGSIVGHYPYRLNGHVSTQRSEDFLYGVAAARMKFPRELGQHAAFWLQPRGLLTTGTTPWGAEIDVVEWYGARKGKRRMASAVHAPMPDGTKRQIGGTIRDPNRYLATRGDSWWTHFHVFSVEWTPERYIFRIDGHRVWETTDGISHVHQFLILSMLSSDYELPDVGTDPNPRTAEVDWVAYWESDEA